MYTRDGINVHVLSHTFGKVHPCQRVAVGLGLANICPLLNAQPKPRGLNGFGDIHLPTCFN